MPSSHSRWYFLLLLGASAQAAPLSGQVSVDIAPLGGFYAPTTDFAAQGTGPLVIGPDRWKQTTAIAYGGEATLWLGSLGVTASYLTTPSDVEVSAGFVDTTFKASVHIATVQAIFALRPGKIDNRVYFAAGVGQVMRRGAAYKANNEPSSTGAALGIGTRIELLPRLGIDLGLQTLIYKLGLKTATESFEKSTQIDLLGRVGVTFRLL